MTSQIPKPGEKWLTSMASPRKVLDKMAEKERNQRQTSTADGGSAEPHRAVEALVAAAAAAAAATAAVLPLLPAAAAALPPPLLSAVAAAASSR